jgi:hypothetical protein
LPPHALYITRACLGQRVRFDWARVCLLLRQGRPRWAAANVIAVWVLSAAFGTEMVRGIALLLGGGGLWLCLPRDRA